MHRCALQLTSTHTAKERHGNNSKQQQRRPLDALSRVRMRPTWLSQTSQAIATLNGIERVRVTSIAANDPAAGNADSSSNKTYWLELFPIAAPTSHIPTSTNQTKQQKQSDLQINDSAITQQPTQTIAVARVLRSQSQVAHLRRVMYYLARDAHDIQLCDFCQQVVCEAIGTGGTNPGRLTSLLLGRERVAVRLEQFVNNLLALTKRVRPAKCERQCTGQDAIPLLVCELLTDDDARAPSV